MESAPPHAASPSSEHYPHHPPYSTFSQSALELPLEDIEPVNLTRNLSTASLTPEACHIEDIADGCKQQGKHHCTSVLHSHVGSPTDSRNGFSIEPSGVNPESSADTGDGLENEENEGNDGREGDEEEYDGLMMMEGIDAGAASTVKEDHFAPTPPVQVQPPTPEPPRRTLALAASIEGGEDAMITASTGGKDAAVDSSIGNNLDLTGDSVPETSPMVAAPTREPPNSIDDDGINWGFDDMEALQEHITGPDPFDQLRHQAPEKSASFPPVPPVANSQQLRGTVPAIFTTQSPPSTQEEASLFNMMTSEAAGNGDRGMFDSPAAENGGFFGSPDVQTGNDFFSSEAARSDTLNSEAARFEEGMPLINQSEAQESQKNEDGTDFFGDDTSGGGDFFGSLGETPVNGNGRMQLKRKSTETVLDSATHPYHSGVGVAASMATIASEVLGSTITETPPEASLSPFDTATSEPTGADDFFSQVGQLRAQDEPEQSKAPSVPEDDLTARWQAALAGDAFLDDEEGFLPSDDEGFLPDSDDEATIPVAPAETPKAVNGTDGVLAGFSNLSTGNIPQVPNTAARYAPQQPVHVQGTSLQQQQYSGWAPQVQPLPQQNPITPYGPSQPQQASYSQIQSSGSAYFNQPAPPSSPYAAAFSAKTPQQPEKKVASFVDKKEGYQSPYDLPMDVGLPPIRKRPNNLSRPNPAPGLGVTTPPMRSSSMNAMFPPTGVAQQQGPPKPRLPQQQQKFFEELPIVPPKSRASSAAGRHPTSGHFGQASLTSSLQRSVSSQGVTQGYQQVGQPMVARSPQMPYSQPVTQSPQLSFSQPMMGQSMQSQPAQITLGAPPPPVPTGRYSPAPPAQQRNAYHPVGPSVSGPTGYSSLPAQAAVQPPERYSPTPNAIQGYQPPPNAPPPSDPYAQVSMATQSVPAIASKYAPKHAGQPQMNSRPPSGGYAAPPQQQGLASPPAQKYPAHASPPQQQQQLFTPPAHHSPPTTFSPPPGVEDGPHVHPRRYSGEHHAMHSSRPGTARSVSISTAMDVPREEEEEGVIDGFSRPQSNGHASMQPQSSPHYAMSPPPTSSFGSHNRYVPSRGSTATPPLRTQSPGYLINTAQQKPPQQQIYPGRAISPEATFQPPPRAQTQSPGMAFGKTNKMPFERPSSAFAHTRSTSVAATVGVYSPIEHTRHQSLALNFVTPTDDTGRDELRRWQGAPIFNWGFGGNVAMMFPRRAQRYTMDMQQPMIKCSPGEVKIKTFSEILPFDEGTGKFPGPVWTGSKSGNKGKKKEVTVWLGDRIQSFEKKLEEIYDPQLVMVLREKTLLWKVVQVMVENDGILEGNPEIEKTIRSVLTPEVLETTQGDDASSFAIMGNMPLMKPSNAEIVDSGAVKTIKSNLLKGDRTAAVWHAVDRRLWAHALLISGTVSKDLYKQVAQEFVKNEVKTLGEGSESLAVLYEIFAGNWEESVDELVSASARMGMPMMSTTPGDAGQNIEERLNRWRETLGLVLSNRSPGDGEAILALGRLLASYGRIDAAHICYIFARQGPQGSGSLFGGPDEPSSDFSLLGADHRQMPFDFARDLDAVMLSEVYEFALSLAPHATSASSILPHLQIYKVHHATILTENGHRSEAQKYCDSIGSAIRAWNKPSPYFHEQFFGHLEELMKRLQECPKDLSTNSGWIPKLTSDTVSSSMWATFNKFVAGDEDEKRSSASTKDSGADTGPFGKISSSPGVSRSQSNVDLYSAYNTTANYVSSGGSPNVIMKQTSGGGGGGGKYDPGAGANRYAPARSSYEGQRSSYDPTSRSSSESYRGSTGYGGYEPNNTMSSGHGGYEPNVPTGNPYDNPAPGSSSGNFGANSYVPRTSLDTIPDPPEMAGPATPAYESPTSGGYEPPTVGYTPYQPEDDVNDDDKTPMPKKKSFMDDDDDDAFIKANAKVKKQEEEGKRKKEAEEKKTSAGGAGNADRKSWFGSWFGKKDPNAPQNGPIKAKLGEESSFVYDSELKRWVNKKGGAETPAASKPPPPPKRTSTPGTPASRPSSVGPPPPAPGHSLSAPPGPPRQPTPSSLRPSPSPAASEPQYTPTTSSFSSEGLATPSQTLSAPPPTPAPGPPKPPGSAPPSRPPTSMSSRATDPNSLDELLGPPGMSRKSTPAGGRKARGKNRYVEVIPGQ